MIHERIAVKKFIATIKNDIWWLIAIMVITVVAMFSYINYFATPIYQKNTQILVNQSQSKSANNIEIQAVQANLQLINTYSSIILSPRILENVQQKLAKNYDSQDLMKKIKVKNTTNSQIIDIEVSDSDPKNATKIANLTAQAFIQEIPKIMNVNNVTILSKANYKGDEQPVKPQKALLLSLAFCIGLLFDLCFIFIKLFFKRTFTSTEEVGEYLDLQVLGEVSIFQKDSAIRNKRAKGDRRHSGLQRRR